MGGFERFRDILGKLQKNYPALSKRMKEAEAVVRWEPTVGAIIAKHARALSVKDRVLLVEVDHPIWKSELHHRKRQILDAMNVGLFEEGSQPLKDIYFMDPRPSMRSPTA